MNCGSLTPYTHFTQGWVLNNKMILQVHLKVKRDERYNLDARKATGFVGLKNQGATCYMNSLLQYLYNLPCFRTVCVGEEGEPETWDLGPEGCMKLGWAKGFEQFKLGWSPLPPLFHFMVRRAGLLASF